MKLLIAISCLFLAACTSSEAQDVKTYKASFNNVAYQCRSIGGYESCGLRLYDCTDGSFRRFDILCATNVIIEK